MSGVEAEETCVAAVKAAWELARTIEPAPGVDRARAEALREAIERARATAAAAVDAMTAEDRAGAEAVLATVLSRGAAIAFAAGDTANGMAWLAAAEAITDGDERAEL